MVVLYCFCFRFCGYFSFIFCYSKLSQHVNEEFLWVSDCCKYVDKFFPPNYVLIILAIWGVITSSIFCLLMFVKPNLGNFTEFKILNRIVFTNENLFRFGMAESDKCVFYQTEVESIEHLLCSCKISSVFWKHVLSWLRDNNIIVENLTL